jgi:VanZ family protein
MKGREVEETTKAKDVEERWRWGVKRWGPVLAWMTLIFTLSAQSQLPSPGQRWLDFVMEKSAHAFEFSVLAALVARALEGTGSSRRRVFLLAVGLSWLYALSDEFHQRFVPGRNADWSDIVADWLGASLGAGLYLWGWVAWRRKHETRKET